jgi:hypothetical protein
VAAVSEKLNGQDVVLDWAAGSGEDNAISDDLLALFRRFICAGEAELTVITLWTIHTHAWAVSAYTPYLAVTSAEKGSGKTRLLEVLDKLVREPLLTASISPAALARIVERDKPTMLLDELDAQLKGEKELAEALRGILNSGFQADGKYTRMIGVGQNMEPRHFSVFCPKALAGIGVLPDTVSSRSIIIRLERAPIGTRESFRPKGQGRGSKALALELERLKKRSAAWATKHRQSLADSEPTCPPELTDRQQDIAEPLLAIADQFGGEWPTMARRALVALFASSAAEDTSIGVRLLADIKDIFDAAETDKLPSTELIDKLAEIETSPWGEWQHGKPMTVRGLAKQLKRYPGIAPRNIRIDSGVVKGYLRESFEDAWNRYVTPFSGSESAISTAKNAACYPVTAKSGGERQGEGISALPKALPSCSKCGGFALYRSPTGATRCLTCEPVGPGVMN